MSDKPMQDANRRDFLRTVGRGLAGAALAALTGGLLLWRNNPAAGQQTCVNRGICAGCGQFDACGLPAALSARQAKERQ